MDDEQIVDEGQAVEFVDDGMGGTVPASVQEPEAPADPLAGVPDEVRDFMQKSGFKDVGALANSYQELRREYTRSRQEPAREPEPQVQRQQTGPQDIDYEAFMDAAGGDPAVAMALLHRVIREENQQELRNVLSEFEQSKIAPLSQVAGSMYWENQASKLRNQHPDEFNKYAGEMEEMFVNDPSLAERPDGMEIAFERVLGRHALANQARSRASQINSGGRGGGRPKDVDPAQAVREAIRGAAGFGGGRDIG